MKIFRYDPPVKHGAREFQQVHWSHEVIELGHRRLHQTITVHFMTKWTGYVAKYIMRDTPELREILDMFENRENFALAMTWFEQLVSTNCLGTTLEQDMPIQRMNWDSKMVR